MLQAGAPQLFPVAPAEVRPGLEPPDSSTPAPGCTNCGAPGALAFCPSCGERQPHPDDLTLRAIGRDVVSEFVSLDGRLWRSLVTLVSRPGRLTQEYFEGRRGRYMRPFSLFVVLNIVFFFARPYTGLLRYDYEMYVDWDGRRAAATAAQGASGLGPREFANAFDRELESQKKTMLLVCVPLFAAALGLLYALSGRRYVEHLVFAVHTYAFLLFYLLALNALAFALVNILIRTGLVSQASAAVVSTEGALVSVLGGGMVVWLTVALRRHYRSGWMPAAARSVVLFAALGWLVLLYKSALFHTTLAFM